MGTTSDKLTYLAGTKDKLKTTINYTGANITNDTFRSYPEKLYNEYIDLVTNGTEILYNNLPKITGSGTNITLNNTSNGKMSITYKGDTQQDSTTGKNLLPVTLSTSTQGNITCTLNKDKSITISGSNTYQTNFGVGTTILPAGTYKATLGLSSGVSTSTYYIRLGNGGPVSAPFILNVGAGDNNVFTLTEETEVGANIIIKGNVSTNITMKPMIRLSSITDDTYEPYTNGPAPNPTYPFDIHNVSGDNTIEICGKNLFDINAFENQLVTGKILNDNGVEVSDVTSTYSKYMIPVKANTPYYRKGAWQRMYVYDKNKNLLTRGTGVTGFDSTFTLEQDGYIGFQISNSYWESNKGQEQIEYGSTSSEYEAYTGQSQLISLGVENLFDKDNANILSAYINATSHAIFSSDTNKVAYIQIKGGTTYTISKTTSDRFQIATTSSLPANNVSTIQEISDNSATSITITTDNTAKYLVVHYWRSSDTKTEQEILDSIQIEKGSKKNSYSPYGASYIELNKISTYQDYIYKDNDRWFLHKEIGKYVYNGEGSVSTPATNYYNVNALTNQGWDLTLNTKNYLSSKYLASNIESSDANFRVATANMNNAFGIHYNGTTIRFKDTRGLSDSDFKTDLIGTIFYFALATPTDTEITDTTLLTQLQTILKSKSGQTNINQENNDLPFILDVSAIKKYE